MSRDWEPDEQAVLDQTPHSWPRTSKLTPELVRAIRQRVDSLSVPWTLQELAYAFGVSEQQIADIARREAWDGKLYEPVDYERR